MTEYTRGYLQGLLHGATLMLMIIATAIKAFG